MYTKGEWKAGKTHNFTGTLVSYIKCGKKHIAQTRLNDTDDTLEENEANANLIAAAPDMYEALKRFLESSACTNNCNPNDMTCDTNFARRALAKAEGGKK